jgi:hypothetical protein
LALVLGLRLLLLLGRKLVVEGLVRTLLLTLVLLTGLEIELVLTRLELALGHRWGTAHIQGVFRVERPVGSCVKRVLLLHREVHRVAPIAYVLLTGHLRAELAWRGGHLVLERLHRVERALGDVVLAHHRVELLLLLLLWVLETLVHRRVI